MENSLEKFDIIIGLEIHAELKTKSKMFCSCDNDATLKKPNAATCPICLGHPGTLPVANKKAIEWTVLVGLALNCKINRTSKFDRKNYFYPDLPKGYQISQYDIPFAYDGVLKMDNEEILITRIHLEEDTGKLTHPQNKKFSLVDYNRAGTPLMEMVTEPVIKNGKVAKEFCQEYQKILRYLEISDADMEKGQMRCEANISVQEKGTWEYKDGLIIKTGKKELNPKVELKNINSFKAVEKAINYEIKRQIQAIESGEKLIQETRGWDENKAKSVPQRIKETAADYRYFPEPDIPPVTIDDKWLSQIRCELSELPLAKKERFIEQYFFDNDTAKLLVSNKELANYTENVISELRGWVDSLGDDWERQKKKLAKISANWLTSELFKHLKEDGLGIKDLKITPENFAELITLIYKDKINSSAGQKILKEMYKNGGDPSHLIVEMGLEQVDNRAELEETVKKILKENKTQVEQYKNGKETLLQFFVGKTMAVTKGKANPKVVIDILKNLLNN